MPCMCSSGVPAEVIATLTHRGRAQHGEQLAPSILALRRDQHPFIVNLGASHALCPSNYNYF